MFLYLWNFLRGYVTIEVTGFSVERFINLAAHRNIYIWDVCPNGSKISMNMSAKGFKKLKGATKKTRCKMRIVKKTGLPFMLFEYRDRKIFALGILFFIAALYLLSSFIWVIDVNGNERIKTSAILSYCEELGLKPGAFKHNINTKEVSDSFMAEFSDLSWLAIEIKGTKVRIDMAETIEQPEIIDKTTPCDVVASSDGLITDMTVISGTPAVKVKDVVKKGDLLVSGMLTIKDGEEVKGYRYTHAQAVVTAKVFYEVNLSENLSYTIKHYTGKTKKQYTLNFMENDFNIVNSGAAFKYYDKIVNVSPLSLGGDFALPISLITTEYKEYTLSLRERTKEDVEILLDDKLKAMIDLKTGKDGLTVLENDINYSENNGKVYLNATITAEKRIDELVEASEDIDEINDMSF